MIRNQKYVSAPHRNFAALDIETAAIITGTEFNWREHRPIGVTCAAVWMTGAARPSCFYGLQRNGRGPSPRMARGEVRRFVRYLDELVGRGFTLVTWNGMGFDWDILAEESGDRVTCRQLAMRHVDMMFHVVCARGHRLGLNRAAHGMGLHGKTAGISNAMVPQLWANGNHSTVLGYLGQDVRTTLELAHACEEAGELLWVSRSGRPTTVSLPDGWLTVREALRLPRPDVSGLENPVSPRSMTAWMNN